MISSGGRPPRGRVQFAVLVKPVPDLAHVRFDAARRAMVRDGVDLVINPFDRRALRVALDLRRPGERVTALAMGPLGSVRPLREALAQGVDEAVLITDPALAQSDTLVTARVLVRALGRGKHDMVLAGCWSTDSETGQVAPEVAALLGVPVLTAARSLVRAPGGDAFEMVGETDGGTQRCRFLPPAVVTVGEKIVRPNKVAPEIVDAIPEERVGRLSLADLGLEPTAVGAQGSPTIVEALVNVEPHRRPVVLGDGTIPERVRAAVDRLRPLLDRPAAAPLPLPPLPLTFRDEDEVLVLVTGPEGRGSPEARGILEEVRRGLPRCWPSPVWVGPPPDRVDSADLAASGGWRGYLVVPPGHPSSQTVARALAEVLATREHAAAIVVGATPFGREVAGQLAAWAALGLAGDAIALRAEEDGRILWGKPSFGGGVIAWIASRRRPSFATFRTSTLPSAPIAREAPVEWTRIEPTFPAESIEILETLPDGDDGWGDLATARVVVAVGTGLGGPDRLPALLPVLARWGAALAATRKVVDAGWVSRRRQVGLTGVSLAPELAVLVGVSGSPNHLVGWRRAKALLAIDARPDAPVFAGVDVGIVGRWEDVLPPLTDVLGAYLTELRDARR